MTNLKDMLSNIKQKALANFPFVNEFSINMSIKKAGNTLNDYEHRHLRSRAVKYYIRKLEDCLRKTDNPNAFILSKESVKVVSNGIILDTAGNNKFFKTAGGSDSNIGKGMLDFLNKKKIGIKTMVDVGANQGEIALYFSKNVPGIKILAIEASSGNFDLLKENCRSQFFQTDNIILAKIAVSDKKGTINITKGLNSENTTVIDKLGSDTGEMETVPCKPLADILNDYKFGNVDFLKIDIEGGEPLLYESIKQMAKNLKAVHIEVGDKKDHSEYVKLLELLWKNNMDCFLYPNETKFSSLKELIDFITNKNKETLEFWFIKK
ncbi:MAG: FkbM family methyltransferase [Candidatus Paceibacterota bacterium]|jgi:FkbM family methyltransferase